MVQRFSNTGNKAYDAIAQKLAQLPNKDDIGKNALIFGLMQDADFRKNVVDMTDEEGLSIKPGQ